MFIYGKAVGKGYTNYRLHNNGRLKNDDAVPIRPIINFARVPGLVALVASTRSDQKPLRQPADCGCVVRAHARRGTFRLRLDYGN
jgi:hypothetical protein